VLPARPDEWLNTLLYVWGIQLLVQSHQRHYVILVPQFLALAAVVEGLLALWGIGLGVERGLRRSGPAPQASSSASLCRASFCSCFDTRIYPIFISSSLCLTFAVNGLTF